MAGLRWAAAGAGVVAVVEDAAAGASVIQTLQADPTQRFTVTADARSNSVLARAGDPSRLIANAEKARSVLGWQPKYPDLETIIRTAWEWHQAHPAGYGIIE